jgi:hypothetical protein
VVDQGLLTQDIAIAIAGASATDTGTLTIAADGVYDLLNDTGISSGGTATLQNAGLLKKTGVNGTSTIEANLTSTGTLLVAALRYCKEQTKPKTVVTLVCDTGSKYLSKMYNDFWMAEQGFAGRTSTGDLRDFISRPFREGAVVAVNPNDPLTVTYSRMRLYDVSQLAVVDGEKLVGIVDEGDLLLAVRRGESAFDRPVREVMTANVRTIDRRAPLDELMSILDSGLVAVVSDSDGFHGIITRIDVLNFLRKEHTKRKDRA